MPIIIDRNTFEALLARVPEDELWRYIDHDYRAWINKPSTQEQTNESSIYRRQTDN